MTPRPHVRAYRPGDLPALYDVCIRTGHEGGDARDRFPDHDLLPDVFAGPYAHLEPELVSVLDDGTRAVGYVVGTADTAAFARRFRAEWLPLVRDRHPAPAGSPRTPPEQIAALLHRPEDMVVPGLADHPAHLHIDLLPEHQRAGHGRTLVARFLGALAARGVPAVHLGVAPGNAGARAFYDRLGFRELPVRTGGGVTYLGRGTHPLGGG